MKTFSIKKLATLESTYDTHVIATGFTSYIAAFDWLTHVVKHDNEFFEIFEEEDDESSSADLEALDIDPDELDLVEDDFEITDEDYLEWCAASCGMTYNAYIGKPWLDE